MADDYDDDDGEADGSDAPSPTLVALLRRAFQTYHGGGIEQRGLLAQLQWIARHTPEGKAGRPADAVGVSGVTWNRWLSRARGYRDREGRPLGSEPSKANRERIRSVIGHLRVPARPAPTRATVRAIVIWNRYQNGSKEKVSRPNPGKVRTVRLDDLDLQPAQASWAAGQDWHAGVEFMIAVRERYDVPVEFPGCISVELHP